MSRFYHSAIPDWVFHTYAVIWAYLPAQWLTVNLPQHRPLESDRAYRVIWSALLQFCWTACVFETTSWERFVSIGKTCPICRKLLRLNTGIMRCTQLRRWSASIPTVIDHYVPYWWGGKKAPALTSLHHPDVCFQAHRLRLPDSNRRKAELRSSTTASDSPTKARDCLLRGQGADLVYNMIYPRCITSPSILRRWYEKHRQIKEIPHRMRVGSVWSWPWLFQYQLLMFSARSNVGRKLSRRLDPFIGCGIRHLPLFFELQKACNISSGFSAYFFGWFRIGNRFWITGSFQVGTGMKANQLFYKGALAICRA